MVCKTIIINNIATIDVIRLKLGNPFNASPVDGEVRFKYKIYKNANEKRKNGTFLQLIIIDGEIGFQLTGSLRKWWFGSENYTDDFNLKTFIRCIRHLAKRLGITETCLWISDFTYLEFGANNVFESKDRVILDCIVGFPGRKYRTYQDESIGFKLTKRETHSLYDKVAEIRRSGHMPSSIKKKLDDKIFALRFELKLNTTDFRKTTKSEKCRLMDVKDNWDTLVSKWVFDFREIELINRLPQKKTKADLTTVTEIKDMLHVLGVEAYGGMMKVKSLVYGNRNIRKKKEIYDPIVKSYPLNRQPEFHDFKERIYGEIFKKAKACM